MSVPEATIKNSDTESIIAPTILHFQSDVLDTFLAGVETIASDPSLMQISDENITASSDVAYFDVQTERESYVRSRKGAIYVARFVRKETNTGHIIQ